MSFLFSPSPREFVPVPEFSPSLYKAALILTLFPPDLEREYLFLTWFFFSLSVSTCVYFAKPGLFPPLFYRAGQELSQVVEIQKKLLPTSLVLANEVSPPLIKEGDSQVTEDRPLKPFHSSKSIHGRGSVPHKLCNKAIHLNWKLVCIKCSRHRGLTSF